MLPHVWICSIVWCIINQPLPSCLTASSHWMQTRHMVRRESRRRIGWQCSRHTRTHSTAPPSLCRLLSSQPERREPEMQGGESAAGVMLAGRGCWASRAGRTDEEEEEGGRPQDMRAARWGRGHGGEPGRRGGRAVLPDWICLAMPWWSMGQVLGFSHCREFVPVCAPLCVLSRAFVSLSRLSFFTACSSDS